MRDLGSPSVPLNSILIKNETEELALISYDETKYKNIKRSNRNLNEQAFFKHVENKLSAEKPKGVKKSINISQKNVPIQKPINLQNNKAPLVSKIPITESKK